MFENTVDKISDFFFAKSLRRIGDVRLQILSHNDSTYKSELEHRSIRDENNKKF